MDRIKWPELLNSNSVGNASSSSIQGSNPASAQNPSTNSTGTGFSLPQVSILGSGQGSAPATIAIQSGAFSSGAPGSSAVSTPTSSVTASPATRTYTFDGIVFTGDSSGLTAGSAIITPMGPPATLSGHTFSLGAAGSSINVDGNLSPLPDVVPTTGLTPGSTSAAVAPSVIASTGSTYTLDGVVLTGNPSSGLTLANSIATPSSQSGSNPSSRLMAANSIITPGGLPLIASGHTFSLPISATGGDIFVDGTLTHLLTPTIINSASPGSSQSDVSAPVTTAAPKPTGTKSQSTSLPSLELDTITSTDTVQPSDASTEGTTNTAFSANYWLTTQVGGQTTVVPVIVGCPGCGGRDGGHGSEGPNDPNKASPSDIKPSETQAKKTDSKTSALSSATPSSTGTLTGTSSAPPTTSSVSSGSACPLISHSFSLPPGTDSTTLFSATGTDAITNFASSSALSSTANSACPLTSYSFSLPPGTDSTTLSSASGSDVITETNSGNMIGQTSSGSAMATSASASYSKASLTSNIATTTAPLPDCMADGAPWYSPTSWCDCGTGKYPTLPPVSSVTTSLANCNYTSLDTSETINPISTSAAPTNIPGLGGIPGCNYVLQGDEQGCANVDYCNCGGTYVGLLTTIVSGTTSKNCDYTIQPTANDCPINTASVNAASTASVASVATAFSPDKTTLVCGQKYATDTGATYTSVPRAQTNDILQNAAKFCTPSKNGAGDTLVFKKDEPNYRNFQFKAPGLMLYQLSMVWDPRPECANVPAPEIRDAVPTGPDYWCNTYFDAVTNNCDAAPGQDKKGGTMYAQCVIWAWEAFNGCTGKWADPNECDPVA
ncbi:MAG: hypothetical protein Q9163_004701 [Psora crenata]